jgi:hypothetical protein
MMIEVWCGSMYAIDMRFTSFVKNILSTSCVLYVRAATYGILLA